MKSLYNFLNEEGGAPATPGNTMGMGDPVADDGNGKGTEPLTTKTAKSKKEKPHKPRKKKKSEEE